ncbi:membrane protein [Streptomyces sp. WM6368]|nr:membrane protein [Streptomyces sp. WM6368]
MAAIITIGPVTVAASMFPAAARRALAAPGGAGALTEVRTLHRICRVYAVIAVVVPVFGLATARSLRVLTSPWLLTSIALTAAAAAVLAALVLPRQAAALAGLHGGTDARATPAVQRAIGQLGMYTGVFNLLWATVTVLMIVRPGSTTGA